MTGASSGIGLEMARILGREYGANFIIVARRTDRLESLAEEPSSTAGVGVEVLAADLSTPDGTSLVVEAANKRT